jgi:hypothetical protein
MLSDVTRCHQMSQKHNVRFVLKKSEHYGTLQRQKRTLHLGSTLHEKLVSKG